MGNLRMLTLAALLAVTSTSTLRAQPGFDEMMGDLANSADVTVATAAAGETVAGTDTERQLAAILGQVDGALAELQKKWGGVTDMKTRRNSPEDLAFRSTDEKLKLLWKSFNDRVTARRDALRRERDLAFRDGIRQAFDTYRQGFDTGVDSPLLKYREVHRALSTTSFTLRRDRSGFFNDQWVNLRDYLRGVPAGDPAAWDSGEMEYAIGLLPEGLLDDLNASINASYTYGYLAQCGRDGYYPTYWGDYGMLTGRSLAWDTYIDDGLYYSHVYNSRNWTYALNKLSRSQTRQGNVQRAMQQIAEALKEMEGAKTEAENFAGRYQGTIDRDEQNRIRIVQGTSDEQAEAVRSAYRTLGERLKSACNKFHDAWQTYKTGFPGDATVTLRDRLQQQYDTYRQSLQFHELDQVLIRYDETRRRARQFGIRRGLLGNIAPARLTVPGDWFKTRSDLYSPQAVVALLPGDVKGVVDQRRQNAFRAGESQAHGDYERYRQSQQPSTTAPEDGDSDWND